MQTCCHCSASSSFQRLNRESTESRRPRRDGDAAHRSFQRLNRESTESRSSRLCPPCRPASSFQWLNRESTESITIRDGQARMASSFQRLNRESTERDKISVPSLANTCSFQRLNRESTERLKCLCTPLIWHRVHFNGSTERALKGAASCASVWTHLIFPVSWSSNGGQPYGAAAATKGEGGTGRIQRCITFRSVCTT